MNTAILLKIFGKEQRWSGPCTVIMDSEAAVHALGTDSIMGGGAKSYAPRTVSGRITADTACLIQDGSVLFLLQQQKVREATGVETTKQVLTIADAAHIVALEFTDLAALTALSVSPPPVRPGGSHQGIAPRPA